MALAEIENGSPDREALIAHYAPDRSRPRLRMNFVTSADGSATVNGRSGGLGSPVDKLLFGLLRMFADAVLVGAGTVRGERYGPLTMDAQARAWRTVAGLDACPRMAVVSGRLDLDPAAALFTQAPARPIVITVEAADPARREALEAVADVLVCGADRVDMGTAMARLRQRHGLGQVLCEGGPHLFGELLAAGLVDELCLTVSPMLAGPGGPRVIAGPPASTPEPMRLISALNANGTLLLRYAR